MGGLREAIVFFSDVAVAKEMFFVEFEAVLDDVVAIPDFANSELRAAFVQIDDKLSVLGLVLFSINFDSRGRVAGHWNIPLRHLLDHASYGPDLGAGPIRVACRSACPVAWYRRQLWDPDADTFNQISAAVIRNRLGIIVEERSKQKAGADNVASFFKGADKGLSTQNAVQLANSPSAPVFHRRYRQKLSAARHVEKLTLAAQAESFNSALEVQAEGFTRQLREREALIQQQKARLDELLKVEQELQGHLDRQQYLMQEKTQELEALLIKGGQDSERQMIELRKAYADELERRLNAQSISLEEALHKRERELYQRATEIVELRAELSGLREKNRALMLGSDDKLLKTMVEKGVVFVAYHPGVEHLVISHDEIPRYLRDPLAYVASRCEVSSAEYRDWLAHYRLPICRATDDDMQYCGLPIKKVMRPMLFRPGESDRCQHHSDSGLS